jgi:hypothetical protein
MRGNGGKVGPNEAKWVDRRAGRSGRYYHLHAPSEGVRFGRGKQNDHVSTEVADVNPRQVPRRVEGIVGDLPAA